MHNAACLFFLRKGERLDVWSHDSSGRCSRTCSRIASYALTSHILSHASVCIRTRHPQRPLPQRQGETEGREGRGGRGEERARRAARDRSRSPATSCCPPVTDAISNMHNTISTLETSIRNICNIRLKQMKHLKHTCIVIVIYATFR